MAYIQSTFINRKRPATSLLRAIFEDGVVSFRLSDVATLADVAERLDSVRALHIGAPVSINVTFNAIEDDRLAQTR